MENFNKHKYPKTFCEIKKFLKLFPIGKIKFHDTIKNFWNIDIQNSAGTLNFTNFKTMEIFNNFKFNNYSEIENDKISEFDDLLAVTLSFDRANPIVNLFLMSEKYTIIYYEEEFRKVNSNFIIFDMKSGIKNIRIDLIKSGDIVLDETVLEKLQNLTNIFQNEFEKILST